MLQASEGGRVYLGRSALETSLREAPVFGPNGSIPVPMTAVPTERIARTAAAEVPGAPDVIERGVLIGRSTLAGLCLTAFACGIITTVAINHGGHAPEVVQQARVEQQQPTAAEEPPAAPAPAKPADVVAAAPAPADPLVVQMAAAPAAAPERAVDKPPAQAVAARTPRPPVTRTPPARRRATPAAPAQAEPTASAPAAPAKWVDPFAE